MKETKALTIIGRAEKVFFPMLSTYLPAKVDTGADLSSIWATKIKEIDDELQFVLFDTQSKHYTGDIIKLPKSGYRLTRVANSFGHKELRYVVKLPIEVAGRKINATFTLADRSKKLYPILLGRRMLKGKFLVDVAKGDPLHYEEKRKYDNLQKELSRLSR